MGTTYGWAFGGRREVNVKGLVRVCPGTMRAGDLLATDSENCPHIIKREIVHA